MKLHIGVGNGELAGDGGGGGEGDLPPSPPPLYFLAKIGIQ